jgi:hypothetical protein
MNAVLEFHSNQGVSAGLAADTAFNHTES